MSSTDYLFVFSFFRFFVIAFVSSVTVECLFAGSRCPRGRRRTSAWRPMAARLAWSATAGRAAIVFLLRTDGAGRHPSLVGAERLNPKVLSKPPANWTPLEA